MRGAFIPEGPEHELIASFSGIGDEVEQQHDHEFRGEHPGPGEVGTAQAEDLVLFAGKELRNTAKMVSNIAKSGMGIASRPACQSSLSFQLFRIHSLRAS